MFQTFSIEHKKQWGFLPFQYHTWNIFSKSFCDSFNFLKTIYIQIVTYCKIIHACSWHRLHNCCAEWKGWDPVHWSNHTSWVAVVNPTDRSKSVRNRCVIEVYCGVCVLSRCFLAFSVNVGAFVIELSQISSFFLPLFCKTLNNLSQSRRRGRLV